MSTFEAISFYQFVWCGVLFVLSLKDNSSVWPLASVGVLQNTMAIRKTQLLPCEFLILSFTSVLSCFYLLA